MLLSLPANPVPSDLYHFVRGGSSGMWLPWYVWGGGVYATKYEYDTNKYLGYLGTVSVPFQAPAGGSIVINSLRLTGSVQGMIGSNEGSMLLATLNQRAGHLSQQVATIFIDRRNTAVTNTYVDVTQSAGGFMAFPGIHSLAIELIGEGQATITVHGLFLDYSS